MKKFINVLAVMLALVMCLGVVVACGDTTTEEPADGTTAANTTPVVTTKQPPVTTTTAEVTTTEDPATKRIAEPTVEVPADGVITNAAQLHAVLVKGAVDANYTVNATELDMTPYTWTGMTGYTGTFDFNGATVKGAIDPLFWSVNGATIKNLKLANSEYSYLDDEAQEDINPATAVAGNLYYSPVICYAENPTVDNIVIEETVKIHTEIWTDNASFGGVIGFSKGTAIVITNCVFKGEISTDSLTVRIGGIAGTMECSDAACVNVDDLAASTSIVANCINYGKVTNLGTGKDSKSGGVVGWMGNAAAANCANYGVVDSADNGQTAGVIAYIGNTSGIINCLNAKDVKGGNYVGGITGYSNGSARYVVNCVNLGVITSNSNAFGAIIGWARSAEKMTNCYNLKSTVKFAQGANNEVDPADATTHENLVITNCANLETIDAIFAAIDAAAPGVFAKTADGTSLVLAAN